MPCNPDAISGRNENWTIGDFVGLDNDGDDLYDGADPDCAANEPPVADPNGPYSGTVGVPLTFDGFGSGDPDGTIVSYEWDFGDGNTDTVESPTHTYASAGTYTVTLTVTDNDGATGTATTTAEIQPVANVPPTADPNGPYIGTAGVALQFDGTGSLDDGTIVAYDWDFGDNNTGNGVSPSHTYAAAGTYTVTLTVTDNDGATGTARTTADIQEPPPNIPPTADPNGPYTGTVSVPLTFDGSGSSDLDGTIVSYDWDFGDTNTGTGVSPTHTYAAAGTYTVTLTVTDNDGATDTAQTTAEMQAAVVNLAIAQFRVTKRVRLNSKKKPLVGIKLVVKNNGATDGERGATVVGTQNGGEVYRESLMVSSPVDGGRTTFNFTSYTPVVAGDIRWTATIDGDVRAVDAATATTRVVP
jgi:PKD repeat protein